MTEHHIPETRSASPMPAVLFPVVAVLLGGALLIALVSAIGPTGVLMLAGVLGSFAFVILTVSRRRPVRPD